MLRDIIFKILICLILLMPFVYSNELYNGVNSAKQIWFYGTVALLILFTTIDLLFQKKFSLKLNAIDLAILTFSAFYFVRTAFTPYMPILYNQRFINWILLVMLYFIIKRYSSLRDGLISNTKPEETKLLTNEIKVKYRFIFNFLIFTGFGEAVWGLLQLYGYLPCFNSNFKITGSFFNPAPYALYLVVIFPLALKNVLFDNNDEIRESEKNRSPQFPSKTIHFFIHSFVHYLSYATVAVILLVLPATMIRAAWIAAIIGMLIVLNYKYHFFQMFKQICNTKVKKVIAGTLTLSIIIMLGTGMYFIKKDSTKGKQFIWEVTLGKISEKPLFGYGIGRFEAEYNNWQAEYFQNHPYELEAYKGRVAGNTKYAFNDFLELSSETGIVGLFLFGVILVVEMKVVNCQRIKEHTVLFYSFMVPFLFIMWFSSPFYSLPILLLFFIVVAFVPLNLQGIWSSNTHFQVYRYATIFVLMIVMLWLSNRGIRDYKAYKTWQQAQESYKEMEKEYMQVYPWLKYNNIFLQYYGKNLAIQSFNIEALTILLEAKNLGGDHVLYTTLGDVYKGLGKFHCAEVSYKHAAYMMPHKMYPHYLLAKLYVTSGNYPKAVAKAKEVIAMNVKFENSAVNEIKFEMKELLLKYSKF